MPTKTITVVTDTPGGWFDPFAEVLVERLRERGHVAKRALTHDEIPDGDIGFYLSCTRITPPDVLARNGLNLVVHASDLPQGRGFSPLVWQILEGRNDIPVCLIEAAEAVDAGAIRMRRVIRFDGHELNPDTRDALGRTVMEMCLDFVDDQDSYPPVEQMGEPSWYARRRAGDSRLDPERSIAEQFQLLRVVDNERYPAFFHLNGRRYDIHIHDRGPASD